MTISGGVIPDDLPSWPQSPSPEQYVAAMQAHSTHSN